MSADEGNARELAELVQQFLSHQVESSGRLSAASKESLAVAAECIEQAFELQHKPGSDRLLRIYEVHKAGPQGAAAAASSGAAPWANVFPDLVSQVVNMAAGVAASAGTQVPPAAAAAASASQAPPTTAAEPPRAPRIRKQASHAEKATAETFKNQGNERMKEDKFKEAHECYSRAIQLDDNNAIYYSNRAAASSKLGDHHAALRDCEEAIEIDPNYSKAYGRKALAHASLDEHQKAKEAYAKAVELDPTNESYRNNLRIAEEKLAEEALNAAAGGASGAAGGRQQNLAMNMMRLMNNPDFMQMATRSLQDPRLQSLIGMAMSSVQGAAQGGAPHNPPDSANSD